MEPLTNRMVFALIIIFLALLFFTVSKVVDYRLKVRAMEEANWKYRMELEAQGKLRPIVTTEDITQDDKEFGHA